MPGCSAPGSCDIARVPQHVCYGDLMEDGREGADNPESGADTAGEQRVIRCFHGCDGRGPILLELGEQLGDAEVRALGHLAVVVALIASLRRSGRRLVLDGGGWGPRDLDQTRVRPLDRCDVGENLPPVPAILVAALLESLGWEGADEFDHLVAARSERAQEIALGWCGQAGSVAVVGHGAESVPWGAPCQAASGGRCAAFVLTTGVGRVGSLQCRNRPAPPWSSPILVTRFEASVGYSPRD